MSLRLHNGFWEIEFAADRARIFSLRYVATGASGWCRNLLKTGSLASHLPLVALEGAQTAYVDASGGWHASHEGRVARTQADGETKAALLGIEYGAVTEDWTLALEGSRLEWTIRQRWTADVEVADMLAPGIFFSAQPATGEPTVFVLWEKDTAKDLFYGSGSILGPECVAASTRQTSRTAGGWAIAKLLSHATPNGDLRVAGTGHRKKGEILNFSSVLGQSPWCDAAGPRRMRRGEEVTSTFVLETSAEPTGLALALEMGGPWRRPADVNRRFFDVYANCGIMADTHDWRLGNQPSGYVALLCRYFHAELLRFGVRRGPLGSDSTNVRQVLEDEVGRMAEHLVQDDSVGPGYQSATSLDLYPSFLACMRDVLLVSGDRDHGERLWRGARRALLQIRAQLDRGGGMICTARTEGNDYWDWISRDGHIGYVNVLAWVALRAAADVARWLGHDDELAAIDADAERVRAKYERDFWDENRGAYADWIDGGGVPRFFLYAPPQFMAIVHGMVRPDRARRVVETVIARRRELGPAWENCFSIQTNLHDAEEFSFMRRTFDADVTRFGETMNGGCLASWNYHWIGALVTVGKIDLALTEWRKFLARVEQTSLIEGSNYWTFDGKPSRTVIPEMLPKEFTSYAPIAAEPFLSDQGLAACALPRWLLGIEQTFAGVTAKPVLPAAAYPVTVSVPHLGCETVVRIASLEAAPSISQRPAAICQI